MKKGKKSFIILIYVILVSLALAGCSEGKAELDAAMEEMHENIRQENARQEKIVEETASEEEIDNELAARAKKEGVSVAEMEQMIDELTEMYASKYSTTKEAYIATLEQGGKTPFGEFAVAADFLGLTIKEFYESEKVTIANLTDEQKETTASMNAALEEASNLDMSDFEKQTDETLKQLQGYMSAGDRVVTVNDKTELKEIGAYEVEQVLDWDESAELDYYEIIYETLAKYEDIVAYFEELLVGTPDYIISQVPGIQGASISGTVVLDDQVYGLYVMIDNEDGDDVIHVEYATMNEGPSSEKK